MNNDLDPASGLAIGCAIGAVLWAFVFFAIWMVVT